MKTNILDIQFDNLTREEARQAGAELLRSSDFHYAVTPNPEFILTADKDLEFQKILNQADLVLPDGIGVVYSAKILGTPLKERVAGFDFACDMLDVLDEMGGRLYLLGSKPGVAEEAGRRILEQHPNIVLCGVHDGYFQDSDPVAHEVAQAQRPHGQAAPGPGQGRRPPGQRPGKAEGPVMAGRLIVFEGTDGSGKSTQFRALCDRAARSGHSFQKLVFPQYSEPSSALIRMYLGGEFGSHPGDVNPYAASSFYAVDRYASFKKVWGTFYQSGGLVLTDRYTTSNAVHQAVKCAPEEREAFLRWLDDFEHHKMGLPRPDLVLYLDMPTDRAVSLLRQRESDTHTQADIHELDTGYLSACRSCALQAAQLLGWKVVRCVDEAGRLRSIQSIHEEIWSLAEPLL